MIWTRADCKALTPRVMHVNLDANQEYRSPCESGKDQMSIVYNRRAGGVIPGFEATT